MRHLISALNNDETIADVASYAYRFGALRRAITMALRAEREYVAEACRRAAACDDPRPDLLEDDLVCSSCRGPMAAHGDPE